MSGWSSGSPVCSHRNLLKTGRLSVCPKEANHWVSGFQGPESGKMGLLFKSPFSVKPEHTLGPSGLALQPAAEGEGHPGLMVSEKQPLNGQVCTC